VQAALEHWQKNGSLPSGNSELLALQFLGILMGNFSLRTMLGLSLGLSEQGLKNWVSHGVTLFLDGAAKCGQRFPAERAPAARVS
jgi:hypothetical protein